MKNLLIYIRNVLLFTLSVVIGIYILDKIIEGNESNAQERDNRYYSLPWRTPINDEYVSLGKLMVSNNIGGCGEYYVKEVDEGEYVIACTEDGDNWKYYVAWPNNKSIYLANKEMELRLTPPR